MCDNVFVQSLARLRYSPTRSRSALGEFPHHITNRILQFFVPSATLQDKLNLFLASCHISAGVYACVHHHILTKNNFVLNVLCPEQVDWIIRTAKSVRKSGPLWFHTLVFTIEDGNKPLVGALQRILHAVNDPVVSFGLPLFTRLHIHYRDTSYHAILRESHIPAIPKRLQELVLNFTHSDPVIADGMRRGFNVFNDLCPTDRIHRATFRRSPLLQKLELNGVPHRFMERFIAVHVPSLTAEAHSRYPPPQQKRFWGKLKTVVHSIRASGFVAGIRHSNKLRDFSLGRWTF